MPHNLHRAGCPCVRCERPPHPSDSRMALRGVIHALLALSLIGMAVSITLALLTH